MSIPYLRVRLAIQQFLIGAAGGLWSPVLAQHLLGLGFSDFEITLCCACGTIANLLTSVLAGQIADRWMATERFLGLLALVAGGLLIWAWRLTSFAAMGPMLLVMAVFFVPCYPLGTSMAFRHLKDPARQFASVRIWATIGWGGHSSAPGQPGTRPRRPSWARSNIDVSETIRSASPRTHRTSSASFLPPADACLAFACFPVGK